MVEVVRKRRVFLPQNLNDAVAFLFLITTPTLVLFYDVFILIPRLNYGHFLHVTFLAFTSANAIGNLIHLIVTDSSVLLMPPALSQDANNPGWRFCAACEANVPPRSFHCNDCKICILKRDHHCIFSGCCIGFYNYRYYMMLITYLWIGAVYSLTLIAFSGILTMTDRPVDISEVIYHICPFFFWLLGKIETKTLFVVSITAYVLCGFLFLSALLVYHWDLIVQGQTTHEKNYKILKYKNEKWSDFVQEVFGVKWIKAWLWFNSESQLRGDGVTFVVSKI